MQVAALFNAARGVTQKHVALRSRQVDLYRQSSLGKAIRSQTERFTRTAKAASFLASRLNETAPSWTRETTPPDHIARTAAPAQTRIPSCKSTLGDGDTRSILANGLAQDLFYEKSPANTSTDPSAHADLDIHQEDAFRHPLPDGTIPPGHSFINTRKINQDVEQERPASESVKEPPVKDDSKDNKHMNLEASHALTMPPANSFSTGVSSSGKAQSLQRQAEQQVLSQPMLFSEGLDGLSSGHDQDSFYERSTASTSVLSSLPRVMIPSQTKDAQMGDEHLQSRGINSDSYYSTQGPPLSALEQTPMGGTLAEQQQMPEGINTDLFYSPRVARMLGGRTHTGKKTGLERKAAQDAPIGKTRLPDSGDQDTLNVRKSDLAATLSTDRVGKTADVPSSVDQPIEDLARDMADQAVGMPEARVSWELRQRCVVVVIADSSPTDVTRNDCHCYGISNARVHGPLIAPRKVVELWRSSRWYVWRGCE